MKIQGMKRNIYEMNYERILPFITGITENDENSKHYKSSGFMDLVVEKIGANEYSLCHYYKQNGDMMQDPEMTVRVNAAAEYVEALSFTQANMGIYQEVYTGDGRYYPRLKTELNSFLGQWLRNLKMQGFIKDN